MIMTRNEGYMEYMVRRSNEEINRLAKEESYLDRAIEILEECGNLMSRKGKDYQGGSVKTMTIILMVGAVLILC